MERDYDAVIAGGSFAGLAVASRVNGRVLLIDRGRIGEGQTSACGTFLRTLKGFGCEDSVLQVFTRAVFHLPGEYEVPLVEPLCTIDYKRFCESLMEEVEAEVLRARVRGMRNGAVVTDAGEYRGRCVVDCTGWRAVLASSVKRDYVRRDMMGAWIETVAGFEDDALHFYAVPHILPGGVAWVFPVGEVSRVGIGSYRGDGGLLRALRLFLSGLGLAPGECHGNFIPYGLREPVVGNIFVVGDAAGQALPVTAEGIRKSLEYGRACGRVVQAVMEGDISLEEGLREYRALVERSRGAYEALLGMQQILADNDVPDILMKAFTDRVFAEEMQKAYLRI